MAKESVKIFSESVDTATKSIKSLRQELKDLKDAMTNVEEGSEEFYKLANKAGDIQQQITKITETVRGASANFGIMLSNSMQSINGIVGGLQAITGALAIFGIQNEDLLKTITKLQGLLSIGSGISQIDNAIKAVDRLRVSITGVSTAAKIARAALQPKVLLAVTAAIAALSAIIGKWKSAQEEVNRVAEENAKILREQQITSTKDYIKELDRQLALLGKIYKIQNDNNEIATNQSLIAETERKIAKYKEELKGLEDEYKEWEKDVANGIPTILSADLTQRILELKGDKEGGIEGAIEHLENKIKEYQQELKDSTALSNAKIIKDAQDAAKKAAEEGAAIWEEIMSRENVKVPVTIEPEIEEIDFDEVSDWVSSQFESKRIKLDYQLATGETDEEGYLQSLISLEEKYLLTLQQGTDEWYKQSIIIADLQSQLNGVNEQQSANTAGVKDYLQVASAGFASLGNIFSNLASLQDTTTQEGIDKQANYQYAAVVMNTANAIIGAWTSAMALPAPASFILGAIQTAAAGVLGGVQIAQVKKAAKEAGANLSGGTSSAANTSSSAVSSLTAPVQYTSEVDKGYISKAIGDTQMWVSVTEIDKVSNRVNVAEGESKY